LHIFRHLAQKSFDRRQPACTIFAQSDKKSDCASNAQSLCGVAYMLNTPATKILYHSSGKYATIFFEAFREFFNQKAEKSPQNGMRAA
jgi:hypothetical protein